MAPKKNKKESGTRTDDATLILHYLREQNRPYSAIEVSANLHNKVLKAQAVKSLRELHQSGKIEERAAGKQVVYHALQDPSQSVTPEIITTLNERIEKLQYELSTIKAEEKTVRAALAAFEAKPRLSDLRQDIERLKEERDALQAGIPRFQEGAVGMQPQEREKLEKDWKQWQRHTTLRRRMCKDLWGKCTEILPDNMTLQELWESLGLEGSLQ